jgi:hypothetical protein
VKHFTLIAAGIDTAAALSEVLSQPNLWNERTERKDPEWSPHHEVDDIWLRTTAAGADRRDAVNLPTMDLLPSNRHLLFYTAARLQAGRIGRAFISRLAPGGKITPHRDIGDDLSKYYDFEAYYSRFHIVLQGSSHFYAGDEVVEMNKGELWQFDGSQEHWIENTGQTDRIHLFFDLRLT